MKVNMSGMGMMNDGGDFGGFNDPGIRGGNLGFMQGPGVPSYDGFKYPYPYEDKK